MSKIKNWGLDQYGAEPFKQQQFGTADVEGVKIAESGRTEQHAAVVKQVAEMFKHGALIDTSCTTEVAEETTAGDHHVGWRILHSQTLVFTSRRTTDVRRILRSSSTHQLSFWRLRDEYYQNSSVLDCVTDTMFTVRSTLMWAVLTGQTDWVCHIGIITSCIAAVA